MFPLTPMRDYEGIKDLVAACVLDFMCSTLSCSWVELYRP